MSAGVDIVIPTVGRECLPRLLAALAAAAGPRPGRIVVVDDRRAPGPALDLSPLGPLRPLATVIRSGGRGPAAARNAGWRATGAEWVAFLDDDVVPQGDWLEDLAADLARLGPRVAASQGRIVVPLPAGRAPTDAERGVQGLERAPYVTADMAYRRAALVEVGGFDERFPRAYREDTDIALRVLAAGWSIRTGRRLTHHPVRGAGPLRSVRAQAGNADDMLMLAIHGPDWRRADPVPGRRRAHALQTALAALALAAIVGRRRRLAGAAAAVWAVGWARFTWARVRPGPRTPREVLAMALSSALIPPAATWHTAAGRVRARRLTAAGRPASEPAPVGGAAPADLRGVVAEEPLPETPVLGAAPDLREAG